LSTFGSIRRKVFRIINQSENKQSILAKASGIFRIPRKWFLRSAVTNDPTPASLRCSETIFLEFGKFWTIMTRDSEFVIQGQILNANNNLFQFQDDEQQS
jgi:hypothetical protein